ncbi:MAG: (deoxy)nucleoside triphosphate pyrophosphohydrolase [Mariprofundus sp.]
MQIQIIALIVAFNNEGQVLLLKRDESQHCGGLWSFPGGKVEANESPKNAAKRELKEETGLIGSNWELLTTESFAYPDRRLHFHLFSCLCKHTAPLSCESPHTWAKADELSNYPMPEANKPFIDKVCFSTASTID